MRALAAVAILSTVLWGTPGATQPVPPLDRLIQNHIILRVPLLQCGAPQLVGSLARDLAVLTGIEFAPAACLGPSADADPGDDIPLIGLSLGEALDQIVAVDPRYAWRESAGVVVLRPLDAWSNRDHFLHRTIPPFGFSDRSYQWALSEVLAGLGKPGSAFPESAGRTPSGVRTFSVAPAARSAIESLDAVVRAHGAMNWIIRYCEPRVDPDVAWVGLLTHDGDGIMTTVTKRRGDAGRRLPPHCDLGQ